MSKYSKNYESFMMDFWLEMAFAKEIHPISNYFLKKSLIYYLSSFQNPYFWYLEEKIEKNYHAMEHVFSSFDLFPCNQTYNLLSVFCSSSYFKEMAEKYKENIYWSLLNYDAHGYSKRQKKKYNALTLLMDNLFGLAHATIHDFRPRGSGDFCEVFQINSFILKVGEERMTLSIPNSENLLYPCARFYLKELRLFVEITKLCSEGGSWNDVYEIFKSERENGRVWLDPKPENIGTLLSANSYDFYVSPESVSYVGENTVVKKKGEKVILDTDLLYNENDVPWKVLDDICLDHYYLMNERYLSECRLERKQ